MPTAYDMALFEICVRVFLTKPIGFFNIKLAVYLPSSDTLKESIWLERTLFVSIGPLLWFLDRCLNKCSRTSKVSSYLNMFDCYLVENIEFEWPLRSLLFFSNAIWFECSKVCITGSLPPWAPLPEAPDLIPCEVFSRFLRSMTFWAMRRCWPFVSESYESN